MIFVKNCADNLSKKAMQYGVTAITSLGVAFLLISSPAMAEGRFSFEKEGQTIIRFDNQTGQIDQCLLEKGDVKCTLSPDDRVKYENEIASLKAKIAKLEGAKDKSAVPTKKDIDQAFDMMQYFMGKFKKMADDEDVSPAPQKL